MSTNFNFKQIIDLPKWRSNSPAMTASAAGASLSYDLSQGEDAVPFIYYFKSATGFDLYNPICDEWLPLASPAMTPAMVAGATSIFVPSAGPRGTLAAGSTTTKVTLTTALPAAVGVNQLVNRGDGYGFKIRIIGSAAGSSGKVIARRIIANTAGTTPTLTLDSPLPFTPATGDAYEFRTGRVFLLTGGVLAAGSFKYYDVLTNSYSGNLSITNLPATISTDSSMLALSEDHTPYTRQAGEGFLQGGTTYNEGKLNCIQGTAAAATTITGSGMPADLATNEFRNFQVRVIEDTVNVTAVGQRRRIASHTSGATGIFTVAAWAVTPSSSAKFVIENDDDKILMVTTANATLYNYNITGNTWDTTTWATLTNNSAAGCFIEQMFSVPRDPTNGVLNSSIVRVRGGATAIDTFDIADKGGASTTGVLTQAVTYGNSGGFSPTTGTSYALDPWTNQGRYIYICYNGTQRFMRYDILNRVLEPDTFMRYPPSTALVGNKLAMTCFNDGTSRLTFQFCILSTSLYWFSKACQYSTTQLGDSLSAIGPTTINLPAAATNVGKIYTIKKIDATGTTVTIDGNASELVGGATTQTLTVQYQTITIKCNGTSWDII